MGATSAWEGRKKTMATQGTRGGFQVGQLLTTTIKLAGTLLSFTAAQFNQIMAAFGTVTFDRGVKIARVSLTGAAIRAAVVGWQNPEATAIIVDRVVLDITTASAGASTIDAGVTETSATTSSDTLLDGVSGTPAAVFDSMNAALDTGANAKAQKLAAGKWVTFDEVSGDTTGMVAVAYIHYHTI